MLLAEWIFRAYIFVNADVHSDDCYCPSDLDTWMDAVECPSSYQQINDDLGPHETIPLKGLREKMIARFPRGHFCHYVIKDNKVQIV